jgi:D-amino-acid dehydrogenase
MASPRSVLVVGGGVVGLCAAHYARRQGFAVTVVERDPPGHQGCSWGNAGLVVPSHFVPLAAPGMIALALRLSLEPAGPLAVGPRAGAAFLPWSWRFCRAASRERVQKAAPLLRDLLLASQQGLAELAARLDDDFGLQRRGLLMLCKTPATLKAEAAIAKTARAHGMDADLLSPSEAAELDPSLELDVAGAVYFPGDGHLDPRRLLAALARDLTARGVGFVWNQEVVGWRADGRRLRAAVTPEGDLAADAFVVAAGSWSARVLQSLGIRLLLQGGKGYSVTVSAPHKHPTIPSLLIEARVGVTPMSGAVRFAGTMEFAGLDLAINRRRAAGMLASISRYLPEFRPEQLRDLPIWAGLRPCSPDGLPYIGRPDRFPNLLLATGHAMLGVSLGPVTGRLIAELLADQPPEFEMTLLSPDRYG